MNPAAFYCQLCGCAEAHPWLSNCRDFYLQKELSVDYVECNACYLVQQFPLPVEPGALYHEYPVHVRRNLAQRWARRVFHRQVYYRPSAGLINGAILDYGCGDGSFLQEMQPQFQTVIGFEPSTAHAANLSRQLGLRVASDQAHLGDEWAGKLDVVTAHFVLEHVLDLRRAFEVFQKVLKPGGLLHIAVPNIRSWEARLFKRRWHGLDAPRHLVFPEELHFTTLATDYGFGDVRVAYASFPNTLAGSISAVLTGRCRPAVLMGLTLPCAVVSLMAPQGTCLVQMRKLAEG